MRYLILSLLFFTLSAGAYAQPGSDSVAYKLERKKINAMLAQRVQKFGQYDSSLTKHTGIFGFQTKKDIRRSNEILMDIVKTDNTIYRELKILLEYRVFQQARVQSHLQETGQSTLGYMNAINKLRNQIDILKAEAEKQEQQDAKTRNILILVIIGLSVVILICLFTLKSKRPPIKSRHTTSKSKRRT
jgi:hypothetical protein